MPPAVLGGDAGVMTDTTSTPDLTGTDTTSTAAANAESPAAPDTPANPYARPQPDAPSTSAASNGFSVSSLVLGIVSIPTGLAVAGIVAIVLGFVGRSREPQARTLSTWGIVLGFVGVFGWVVFALLGIAFAAPFALWGMSFGWTPDVFDLF